MSQNRPCWAGCVAGVRGGRGLRTEERKVVEDESCGAVGELVRSQSAERRSCPSVAGRALEVLVQIDRHCRVRAAECEAVGRNAHGSTDDRDLDRPLFGKPPSATARATTAIPPRRPRIESVPMPILLGDLATCRGASRRVARASMRRSRRVFIVCGDAMGRVSPAAAGRVRGRTAGIAVERPVHARSP